MLGLAIFNSCEEKGGFGIATDDVAPVEFVSTELDINSSMVKLDSIITSRQGRLLVGNVNHPDFGALETVGYTALSARTAVQPEIPSAAQLDSVKFNFRIGYAYDTTSSNRDMGLEIYDIGEEFPDTTYISSNTRQIGNRLLASGDFVIEDFDSTYTMHADMTWGNEFFEGVRSKNSNFTDQNNFRTFFPGLTVKSKADQGNVFSIVPGETFEVIFYYQQPNSDNTDVVNLSFKMDTQSMVYFYELKSDLSTTQFAEIQDVNTPYENTPKLAMLTSLGLVPRIDLSELSTFSDANEGIIVNEAILEIGPIDDMPDGTIPPNFILLYLTDERNTLIPNGTSFRAVQFDGANQLGGGNAVQFFFNPDDRVYSGSITSYVQSYYNDGFRRDQMFIYPSEMNFSLKGLTIPKDQVSLKIFYSELR
ncbi:DUF4270 family protein [Roseivirga sp.]|uniref:DUF4270 family protein n=1 Tax=Roseivirga sp. TaxID=1964215 RepID=UPI003B52EED5